MTSPFGCIHQFLDKGLETPECPICQEEYVSESCDPEEDALVRVQSCGDYFHRFCLIRWIETEKRNTCPACRSVLYLTEASEQEMKAAAEDISAGLRDIIERLDNFSAKERQRIVKLVPEDVKQMSLTLKNTLKRRRARALRASPSPEPQPRQLYSMGIYMTQSQQDEMASGVNDSLRETPADGAADDDAGEALSNE